jgi:phenylalanyl-tRNA synthetase beta chain
MTALLMDLGMNLEASEVLDDDVVLELEITANRPDALSHLGIAREVAAKCGVPLKKPAVLELPVSDMSDASDRSDIRIRIEDAELCPRYGALVVEDVKIGPSPDWLARRLERAGIRPINVMVDITNYVLAAVGHPLHAFDLDLLADRTIIVRKARAGETMRTLDGVDRKFRGDECLICDARRPVAIAGVMGGVETELHDGTRRALLESAYFDPDSVRRTGRFHALNTEASQRFGRGADPEMPPRALMLAARLIRELGCGTVRGPVLDVHTQPCRKSEILLHPEAMKRFFEFEFEKSFLLKTFRALEFEVEDRGDALRVVPPSFRADIREEVDLYEEAARFHGYNNLPSRMPAVTTGDVWELPHLRLVSTAQDLLAGAGLLEVYSYAFATRAELEGFEPSVSGQPVEISNPLNAEEACLRMSMVPGLLRTLTSNARKGQNRCALFEVGKVYALTPEGDYAEALRAGILLSGPREYGENNEPRPFAFFHLKGILEDVLGRLRGEGIRYVPDAAIQGFKPNGAARILLDGRPIGIMGEVPQDETRFPAWAADISLEPFLLLFDRPPVYQAASAYPSIPMDLTVAHGADLSWEALEAAIRNAGLEFLEELQFKYRYVTGGEIRTTVGLVFQSRERSLTQEEVNAWRARLADHLTRHHPVHI